MSIMMAPVNETLMARFESEYAREYGLDCSKYVDGSYILRDTSDAYEVWFSNELSKEQ